MTSRLHRWPLQEGSIAKIHRPLHPASTQDCTPGILSRDTVIALLFVTRAR
ncbi:hypothetical protein M422DRAFT_270079 [Sphaerobolus stellatus SS14]|uniref:Uncharacterized protein n=1 Tax=Sphaerobolus stellatus (strain SS14) TaxID=990650 RepID=A0A0C9UTN2_SPHS4|nr:hypothetical protein M422DRAFT_270079 [Sphaerobolus stellatus SS14]